MTTDEIIKYCLSKNGAYVDFPFGEIPMCIKVSKRLFAQIYPSMDNRRITLNCDRAAGEFYRNAYPGAVIRGCHCPPVQQPYFNTVCLDMGIPDEQLRTMIDHSYCVVVGKLTKKQRDSLNQAIHENKEC